MSHLDIMGWYEVLTGKGDKTGALVTPQEIAANLLDLLRNTTVPYAETLGLQDASDEEVEEHLYVLAAGEPGFLLPKQRTGLEEAPTELDETAVKAPAPFAA